MKNINIGIFYGTLFSENLGCDALNYSLLQMLDTIAGQHNEHHTYYLFWDVANTFPPECLPRELRGYDIKFVKVPASLTRLFIKGIIKDRMRSFSAYLKAIRRCDIFFDACAGDSFSDIYGNYTLNYIKNNHRLVNFFKKPMIMLPQTIGPFYSETAKRMGRDIMRYAQFIFARDDISHQFAKQYVNDNKLDLSVDMALFMNYERPAAPVSDGKILVALAPSALLWNGGYTNNNQFQLKEHYPDVIRDIADFLSGQKNIKVILLGHVLGGNAAAFREDDYFLCKRLQYAYPEFELAPYFYTPMEAKSYLANMDAVLASRMHCCIGAFSAGVPVFPLGYSRKFEGLFQKTLNYPHGADLRQSSSQDIISTLEDFLTNLPTIKDEVKNNLPKLAVWKQDFLQKLDTILERNCRKK